MTEHEVEKLDHIAAQLQRLAGSIQGNGGKGLVGQVEENSNKIDTMSSKMEHVQTVEGCLEAMDKCRGLRKDEVKIALREELSTKGRNKWLVRKDAVLILVAVLSLVLGSGLLPRLVEKSREKQTMVLQQELEDLSRKMGEIEKAIEQ